MYANKGGREKPSTADEHRFTQMKTGRSLVDRVDTVARVDSVD
jgi:hypothetical protein